MERSVHNRNLTREQMEDARCFAPWKRSKQRSAPNEFLQSRGNRSPHCSSFFEERARGSRKEEWFKGTTSSPPSRLSDWGLSGTIGAGLHLLKRPRDFDRVPQPVYVFQFTVAALPRLP